MLAGLHLYGLLALDFAPSAPTAIAILGSAVAFQWIAARLVGLPRFAPSSALVSGLSLALLLRTPTVVPAILATAVTIGSKFTLRWRGRHLFNPTNLGLVSALGLGWGWTSPGRWGSGPLFAFGLASFGALVLTRAERADVSVAFLTVWSAILFGRALWLGDPMAIPRHQLGSGALLVFAFFMLSDPKTTPSSRAGRLLFAVVVAAGAAFVRFGLFRTNGLFWSLACCSLLVPTIDRLVPGPRYEWPRDREPTPLPLP